MGHMLKQLFFLITAYICLFASEPNVKVSAKSAILIDAKTGKILYEKNAHDRFFPASLTKIATLYYTLETVSDLEQLVTPSVGALIEIDPKEKHENYNIPPFILEKDGTKMYGVSSEKPALLKDLLYGLMLVSGNNAANVLAEAVSGDIPSFVEELNAFLKRKGLNNTYFKNPHGLHYPGHYSSAYDLAILTKNAMENPIFAEIVKTTSYNSKSCNYEMFQRNKLLCKSSYYYYPKATGVKLGYTSKSGHNLVATAEDENRSLVGVVLGCEKNVGHYKDMIKLFDTFMSEEIVDEVVFFDNQVFEKTLPGAKSSIKAIILKDLVVSYHMSTKPKLEAFIEWTDISLPIKKGQVVGKVIIKDEDRELASANLYSENNVNKEFGKVISDLFLQHSK